MKLTVDDVVHDVEVVERERQHGGVEAQARAREAT